MTTTSGLRATTCSQVASPKALSRSEKTFRPPARVISSLPMPLPPAVKAVLSPLS